MNRPILLVEDDPDDEAIVRRALSGSRVPNVVVAVRDGGEALDYLFTLGAWRYRNAQDQPALVLLDIDLPTVNGFEVLRQIRADPLTRNLPVVMLTSSRNPGDVVSGYDAGANSYVVKPVDLDQFLELTRALGKYWSQINSQIDTVPSAARDRESAHEPTSTEPSDVERRLSRYDRFLQTTKDAVWDWNVVTHEGWWNRRHY